MKEKQDFILITGASKGIGATIANFWLENREEAVVGLARNFSTKKINDWYPISIDITKDDEVFSLQLPENLGRLKALILNAGTFYPASILNSDETAVFSQFQLNVFSIVSVLQRLQPYFEEGFTHIFITASSASYSGIGNAGMYAASKHAVLGLARSLREELKTQKIKVTAIAPGSTWSSSWEGSEVDPNTLIDPVDIAKVISSLCELSFRTNVDEIILNPL